MTDYENQSNRQTRVESTNKKVRYGGSTRDLGLGMEVCWATEYSHSVLNHDVRDVGCCAEYGVVVARPVLTVIRNGVASR